MSSCVPVAVDTFHVPLDSLRRVHVWAAVDKGVSLTKVLFADKQEESDVPEGTVTLHCHTYHNDQFYDAVTNLIEHVRMPTSKDPAECVLRVTGAGCDKEIKMLRERMPFQVKFVDEMYTQGSGFHWMLKNVELEELCYPADELHREGQIPEKMGFLEKIRQELRIGITPDSGTGLFPCVVVALGSAIACTRVEENGETHVSGGTFVGGRTFMSLGGLLLGTTDYNELVSLAESGDRRNTDTQVHEMFSSGAASPYGMPPDSPVFPFGKALSQNKKLSEFRREDLAASLVNMFAQLVVTTMMPVAQAQRVRKVFLGGNMFRSKYFRQLFWERAVFSEGMFDIRILKTGHTGAVGAMMAEDHMENNSY